MFLDACQICTVCIGYFGLVVSFVVFLMTIDKTMLILVHHGLLDIKSICHLNLWNVDSSDLQGVTKALAHQVYEFSIENRSHVF